jgi:hypothetical protein
VFDFDDRTVVKESHGFNDGFYETFSCCPNCGGDWVDAVDCCKCGETFEEGELYDGWCEKCLRETINYDTFFEYCEANKDEQYLDIFVMSELLGGMDCPKNVSYEFHKLMIDEYKRTVKFINDYEKAFGKPSFHNFIDACIRFIMDDDGSIGRENYAEWLNKREVKTNA